MKDIWQTSCRSCLNVEEKLRLNAKQIRVAIAEREREIKIQRNRKRKRARERQRHRDRCVDALMGHTANVITPFAIDKQAWPN